MFSPEFLLTSLVVALIPGTGAIYTISTGLFHGRWASLAAALGCTAGIVPHLIASVLGLSFILHMSALAFQGLKFAGAAYLLYLAWATWQDKGALKFDSASPEQGFWRIAGKAVLLNLLNPKLTLFFFAFLPHFIVPDAASSATQFVLLSLVFMAITLAVFAVYGLLASTIRQQVARSPRIVGWLRRSFAAAFAALSVQLALTDR